MKKYLVISITLILLGCSSQDKELDLYCNYQKQSFEIIREANLKFPTSSDILANQNDWIERRDWVEAQHIELTKRLGIEDKNAFEQNALNKGWLPSQCKK